MNTHIEPIVTHEFQVTKPNGDIDFVEVYDLPLKVATNWIKSKYEGCKIEFYKTTNNPILKS